MNFCTNTRTIRLLTFISLLLAYQYQQTLAQVPTSRYWQLYDELHPVDDHNPRRLNGAVAMYKNEIIAAKYGTAYVYSLADNGTWQTTALEPTGDKNSAYGFAVAIHGNYAIVGAHADYQQEYNPGQAFILERNAKKQWQFKVRLEAPVPKIKDEFGYAVAISDNYAVVGAPGRDGGAAYVYQRNKNGQWGLQKAVLPLDSLHYSERFGHSVAITSSGSQIIVGNPNQNDERGVAYIFTRDNRWQQTYKLLPSDPQRHDSFGWSVTITEQQVLIGAPQMRFRTGKAYIFKRQKLTNWAEQAILSPPDGYPNDFFGYSVAMSERWAVIGAAWAKFEYSPDFLRSGGAAYVFQRKGDIWRLRDKLFPSEFLANGQFGRSVGIANNFIAVGHKGYSIHQRPIAVFKNSLENTISPQRNRLITTSMVHKEVKVFPNPVIHTLIIQQTLNAPNHMGYSITNQQGKQVITTLGQFQDSQLKIPVKHLKPGVYFLRLTNSPEVYRFVKK
ncbi:hypothetical protein BKI52_35330 [marine bacterium AO1-C]|nr:hypothetical protein BKI52_35330 [marine bacterium AO1-C]